MLKLRNVATVAVAAMMAFSLVFAFGSQTTAFAAGGHHGSAAANKTVISPLTTCNPVTVSLNFNNVSGTTDIFYVNTSGSVNVRQGPGTGYCVITTQGPTMNVVAVPTSSGAPIEQNANGYTWVEIAYYQGTSNREDEYDYNHVGWMALTFLTQATHAYECVTSGGCDTFIDGNCIAGCSGSSWWLNNPPNSYYPRSQSNCLGSGYPLDGQGDYCEWENQNSSYYVGSSYGQLDSISADSQYPSWFVAYMNASGIGDPTWMMFENWDWWAN